MTMIVVKFIYYDDDDYASLDDELDDWRRGIFFISFISKFLFMPVF